MRKRTLIALGLTLSLLCFSLHFASSQENGAPQKSAKLKMLKAVFKGRPLKPGAEKRFQIRSVDLNGDKKLETIIVENPNPPIKKPKKGPTRCLCPKPKLKGKRTARFQKIFARQGGKDSFYNLTFKKVRKKRFDIHLFYNQKVAKTRNFRKWMMDWCAALGRLSRKKRWRYRRFYLTDVASGTTAWISVRRCRYVRRRRGKRRFRYFRRRMRPAKPQNLKTCPCPKKKKKPVVAKALKPLRVTVVRAVKPKNAPPDKKGGSPAPGKDDSNSTPQVTYRILGNLLGDEVQIQPLTRSSKILCLLLNRTTQTTPTSPRNTYTTMYIYDEGGSGRMKQVWRLKTSVEGGDRDGRRWSDYQLRNMDADEWLEIVVNHYYENPSFNGRVARQVFKWREGKYVKLNQFRGILNVTASSTWKRIAPKGSPTLRRYANYRTRPQNAADGILDTAWVGAKPRRSIGDWLRLGFARNKKLIGVAIAAVNPDKVGHVIPDLYKKRPKESTPPTLAAPMYVQIKTSAGVKMAVPLHSDGRFKFIRFPNVLWTRFLKITILGEYRDSQNRKHKVPLAKNENTLGFISEVVPIEANVRYTSSSFEYKGNDNFPPAHAGDNRTATAWAEGRTDNGIGEWLQMILPIPRAVTSLKIVNGCRRPGERYILNNRIKTARLHFSNGSTQDISLKDTHKPQTIKVRSVRTRSILLRIQSIYKGKIGHLTCMAEFHVK